jgi:cytochrome b6-f complex iron-sulfur subunit
MTDTTPTTPQNISRRDFLKLAWAFFGGLAALEVGGMMFAYLQPRLAEGEFGSVINLGAVENFPPNSVTHITNGRFYLVRLADGGMIALYHRCTHLGCAVPYDTTTGQFVCPCHSSEFDRQGEVQNPPAPRPLDLFAITIVDGEIKVDTGEPIQRQSFDPSQVVYAS